ncbi:zinc-dependent peptidase [Oceanobacter mangrovi]|uniref:M90 family metallopeptidase n=1 Tax=Oceanobacter mangrovi TaxID=2862510 RepID=UPI001C8EBF41|nr:M90 family metallopeptidase [Oceanobacter mangrovi]
MFEVIEHWLEHRHIQQLGFTRVDWDAANAGWQVLERYSDAERQQLFELTLRFLVHKVFASGRDFELTGPICLKVATMACVPILNLGLNWYDEWQTLILYEGDFRPKRPYRSADGVVHEVGPGLSGEAWQRGPVILSWDAIQHCGPHARSGKAGNVVIHELAHKLDMLNDGANGAPPLHKGMNGQQWHDVFEAAWEQLQQLAEHQHASYHYGVPIDAYGLTNPAEFFAVCSETFFEAPQILQRALPDLYQQLSLFYRQDPAGLL